MNAAHQRDNARGEAGEVRKADYLQRSKFSTPDLFPDTLPVGNPPVPQYSTATEAQRRRIIEMLGAGPKTTLDFRRAGVMQSQTRIFELRAQGYDIPTVSRVTIHDDQGFPHHGVALYALHSTPGTLSREGGRS